MRTLSSLLSKFTNLPSPVVDSHYKTTCAFALALVFTTKPFRKKITSKSYHLKGFMSGENGTNTEQRYALISAQIAINFIKI